MYQTKSNWRFVVKKLLLVATVVMSMSSAFAAEGDLVLPGAKWIAKFNKYVCAAFGPEATQPAGHSDLKVKFEQITTDSTLDNGLITASFKVEGKTCRYSALLLADNAAATIRLVESKAFAPEGDVDCSAGKAELDASLESNDYLYYGHPHNLAIMAPVTGAEKVCGGQKLIGVNFVVSGRISQ